VINRAFQRNCKKYIWLKLGRKKESKFKDKEKNGRYSYKKESV